MMAQVRPKRVNQQRQGAARRQLIARTKDVLSREIGFIPNPGFREMDADRAWRDETTGKSADVQRGSMSSRLNLPAHLERMCSTPLLTPEEERDLFCRMNYVKYRANALRSRLSTSRPSAKRLDEIEQLLLRANELRNRIITANTRLVVSIVKKFADETNRFDDLLSEGINCLLKAVEKFDFNRGFRFSTYATMAVRREVFHLIKRSHRDRNRFATGNPEMIDEKIRPEETGDRSEGTQLRINNGVDQLIDRLDDREQFIVRARFGMVDLGTKATFSKLGEELGVSKERVRQLEMRALGKLRNLIDDLRLSDLRGLV